MRITALFWAFGEETGFRLFMAPGMGHCSGGPGPNAVGGVFGLPSPIRDPEHDVISALARWVEDGKAPGRITATLYRDNDPSKEVVAQRPWCAYPVTARYSGQGDRTRAAWYICEAPSGSSSTVFVRPARRP